MEKMIKLSILIGNNFSVTPLKKKVQEQNGFLFTFYTYRNFSNLEEIIVTIMN